METVASRIRELNHPRVMSDKACAEFIGVTPSLWSQWKLGQTRSPKSHQLIKISETTGLNLQWLTTGEGDPMGCAAPVLQETPPPYGSGVEVMMGKAWAVLTSGTVYATALSANVDAFHQAVVQERENAKLGDRLEKLEQTIAAIHCGNSQEAEVEIAQAG